MAARLLIALGAGLALADASIVTLALPPMLAELDTTVEGVAAVIAVYTAVLAAGLLPAAWLLRRTGARAAGAAGFAVFALAGALCGAADDLSVLLACRALQAAGAAVALVAAFALLGGGRAWAAAALLGAAVGPALGGALTEAFDWRAIFLAQAPVGVLAAIACVAVRAAKRDAEAPAAAAAAPSTNGASPPAPLWQSGSAADPASPPPGSPASLWPSDPAADPASPASPPPASPPPAMDPPPAAPGPTRALVSLAALSAALTGVLFLVVLLLVAGWSLSPLAAAAVVSVLPLAALAGSRVPGPAAVRAAAGCGLVAGGVLACAWLPGGSAAWVIAPLVVAGVGMGLALPALAGELLPERTPAEAARSLTVRHAGITLVLLLLAPVTAAQLDRAVERTRERGAALLLDAKLPPLDKLALAGPLVAQVDPADPRDGLRRALEDGEYRFAASAEDSRTYARVRERADETLVAGLNEAFRAAFLICGAFALVGAVAVLPAGRRGRTVALAVTGAALLLPLAHFAAVRAFAPEPVRIADPCQDRELPDTGGIAGALQDAALALLDRAACDFGSSREALALALADPGAARDYEREYGVNPRSAGGVLQGILPFIPG